MEKQIKLDFRGGKREGAGRTKIGETRRIALTLPPEDWEYIDSVEGKTAEVIRSIIQREVLLLGKKLPVASHLTDSEYQLLMQVYANHNRSMGLDKRKDYTLSDIVKVVSNTKENCLEVYYKNGDWWHYSVDGTWY